MNHITEEAELYALGLLEPEERARVDEHVLICDPCVRRLARAEATVLSMVDASVAVESAPPELAARVAGIQAPPRAKRTGTRRFGWASAIAAAFALSTGVLTQQHLALVSAVHSDGQTLDAMVHSHFAHAQFATPGGAPIDAKVLYDRHGSWYEVIASPGSTAWSVTVQRPGESDLVMANRFVSRGDAVYMRFTNPGGVSKLELRDASGQILGVVKPLIASEKE
jgi:Putative zinc-finger